MPNRLANETSPYLRQHKDNPVDWYPWGEEALARANSEDKPIFLSVGYSTCHWCHVMARESFEDEQTAAFLNEHFVCIKVDREERPEVDSIYMRAVQAATGRGGWPMSVWLLPDGRPFYGGTYFPDTPRHGMPSFRQVLTRVLRAFREDRIVLEQDASTLTRSLSQTIRLRDGEAPPLDPGVLEIAFQGIAGQYDRQNGGFSTQPKFPPAMTIELLLRLYHRYGWRHALDMAFHTLDRMAWGGIHDQIGGGFHRYAVDALWLVPHFEKMLYDNALLLRAYLYGYQVGGEDRYLRVVDGIIDYLRREMTDPRGGFYSAQDADSEGHEGKFFVWAEDEIREALQGRAAVDAVLDYWGVAAGPNFEGGSVLWVPESPETVATRHRMSVESLLDEVERSRSALFDLREKRTRPDRDDKILTAWNGLAISSLAQAARALDRDDILSMALRAADFVLNNLLVDGHLRRSYKDGQAKYGGYLEDYAFFIEGLIELYQATLDGRWLEQSLALTETMIDLFWDDKAGFYDTARDHETLVARPQETTDNALPSGTSAAVAVLLRMAVLAGRPEWREPADRILAHLAPAIRQYPVAFCYLASQLDFALGQPHEIALVGDPDSEDMRALLNVIRRAYRPNQVVALRRPGEEDGPLIPLLVGREMVDGRATAYVCRQFVCQLPVTDPESLREQLAMA
ncbi:MAG: thioredoxin domain-containing protein [Anaerolineae bacterium]|nr:thioredoxin domain-containing protein [Anaerolineae bacterium]